ncbi:MAG TPA: RHS repeat-associated core domain-containing protein [Thermoanaerobaculia bacterium]
MISSGGVPSTVAFGYDSNFRLTSEGINGANSISFGYDNDDLLTSAGALTLRRDAGNGLLTGTTLSNLVDTYGYNGFGEVTSYAVQLSGSPLITFGYGRDDGGRIATKTETVNGQTTTTSYGYDPAGRLTDVTTGTSTTHYGYDENGNRTSVTSPSGTIAATYDAQDRMTTYNGASYFYSDNGELQKKIDAQGTTLYNYDVLGNLRSVSLPDRRLIEYVIDASNRRVGKKVNGTLTTGWIYGDQLRIIAETDGTGAVTKRFVYGSRTNVPEYMTWQGSTYRIITDHLGSPRYVLHASAGTLAEAITDDEFGNVLSDTNLGFVPFGFAGGLYDPDTKLVRFGARDVDLPTGRWTAKDPILFAGTDADLYNYAFADPVNYVDPFGLDALTQDPNVRRCFFHLWKLAGFGADPTERSTWITHKNSVYGTVPWASSATPHHDTWPGDKPIPDDTVAQAHTHPDSLDPRPSTGGSASRPTDAFDARSTGIPYYTISRKGIWKVDPQGHVSQEEGPNWRKGLQDKDCSCQ